jgi:hypothetical protein
MDIWLTASADRGHGLSIRCIKISEITKILVISRLLKFIDFSLLRRLQEGRLRDESFLQIHRF